MGRVLADTAVDLGCSERTLRRYVNDGVLRGRRVGSQLELSSEEESYATSHWMLLKTLKWALRSERDVRLAVLFGSTAVGEDHPGSDVDLLIAHRHPEQRALASLRRRLRDALAKPVHVVSLDQARSAPSLFADILAEGRVLIDRDDLWGQLTNRYDSVLRGALQEEYFGSECTRDDSWRTSTNRMNASEEDQRQARLSKGQRQVNTILQRIPAAREQLLVAIEGFAPDFDLNAFVAAAESPDARERNRVAVIEREYEVLLNWCNELAARLLSEGQRLGTMEKTSGYPWERLAALGAISQRSANRLQEAMEMRDELGHAYPPANWRALHEGVETLLHELDRYIHRTAGWATEQGILPG
jgi:predicted nucleotidyltransferase